jgi:hypothetical protein
LLKAVSIEIFSRPTTTFARTCGFDGWKLLDSLGHLIEKREAFSERKLHLDLGHISTMARA